MIVYVQPSSAKVLCDLDKDKTKDEDELDKKEPIYGLRTDMYAKKALHVSETHTRCLLDVVHQ